MAAVRESCIDIYLNFAGGGAEGWIDDYMRGCIGDSRGEWRSGRHLQRARSIQLIVSRAGREWQLDAHGAMITTP
jgi:hypothetical protein